eukprot:CAMPEP_0204287742 /NCGR_PEP_ID=MMETSP0468-20130131/55332_1 /ASSEMBLY_ACC=CAM_ASM_000383 /TAXON_ID=2969 /ORGANISM="Oxyrrhis marina" /LENGTH=96 /DNA_ID=CAMNT_0051265759 /DNA_START=530 /DNA_END=820 /DNA_ORIENTATION=+
MSALAGDPLSRQTSVSHHKTSVVGDLENLCGDPLSSNQQLAVIFSAQGQLAKQLARAVASLPNLLRHGHSSSRHPLPLLARSSWYLASRTPLAHVP